MKTIFIRIAIILANLIYFFIKLFPTKKNKVVFISRQDDKIPLDFEIINEKLKKKNSNIKTIIMCKRLKNGILNKFIYCFHIIRQMYNIATSKVVILDSYCIPICILKHKKNLTVIQIWHALGSLKKFGYSVLDKNDGRSSKIAKEMKMHKNYTYILTSSEISKPYFKEAFNATEEQMKVMSLPRVDFLQSKEYEKSVKDRFYEIYPELINNKEIIFYCPTKRKNEKVNVDEIVEAVNFDKYNLIVKLHNGQEFVYLSGNNISEEINFSGMELLHVADYIITDYSAIVYEAAIVEKPIYFYNFDNETYINDRGWYIEYEKEMPGPVEKDIKIILKLIENKQWDKQKIIEFKNKYIDDLSKDVTEKIAKLILDNI